MWESFKIQRNGYKHFIGHDLGVGTENSKLLNKIKFWSKKDFLKIRHKYHYYLSQKLNMQMQKKIV